MAARKQRNKTAVLLKVVSRIGRLPDVTPSGSIVSFAWVRSLPCKTEDDPRAREPELVDSLLEDQFFGLSKDSVLEGSAL